MSEQNNGQEKTAASRRDFIKTIGALGAGSSLLMGGSAISSWR
jgi:hypothetical protein